MRLRLRTASVLVLLAAFARAAALQIDFPKGGERLAGGQTVRWSVPDGDKAAYEVEYSHDGGATWASRARGLREPRLVLDFDELAGCEPRKCLVRVRAGDGAPETIATSGGFTVAKKPPQVRIVTPRDGATLELDVVPPLVGWGEDPEDGALRGESLVWTSDIDGSLGTGEHPIVRLSEGPHVLTLTGRDRDGNRASTSVRVRVERRGPGGDQGRGEE